MAFFADKKIDEQLVGWATKLREALSAARKLGPPGKGNGDWKRSWPRVFGMLRKEHQAEVIERVLSWYCANLGQEFVPHAWTAQSFRMKFAQILACFERQDVPQEPDQRSKDMAKSFLNDYTYPIEVAVALPRIIQKTRERWEEFSNRIHQLRMTVDCNSRTSEFLHRVLEFHAPVFVENWLLFLHRMHGRHEHYTGPVASLVFSPKSQHFRFSFWHAWSHEWCKNPTAFDNLLDELIKE